MSLKKNAIYLIAMQGVNYIAPLILVPYLTRVLGVDNYGVLGLSITISQYLILFTDFGFNLTASKKVSQYRSCKYKVSVIFWHVFFAKFILMIMSLLFLTVCVFSFDKLHAIQYEIYLVSISVIGSLILPSWLFQGFEKTKIFSLFNILIKLLLVPATLYFVKDASDLLYACALQGGIQIGAGVMALLFVIHNDYIVRTPVKLKLSLGYIKSSAPVFFGNFSISLYTLSTPLVLGLVNSKFEVGLYSATDRIRGAVIGIFLIVGYAIYPRVSYLFKYDKCNANKLLKKIFYFQLISGVGAFVVVFYFSHFIVGFLFGDSYRDTAQLLKLMAPMFVLVPISILMANYLLLPNGYQSEYAKNSFIVCLLHLMYIYPLCKNYGAIGGAYAILISEIISFMLLFYWTSRHKLLQRVLLNK